MPRMPQRVPAFSRHHRPLPSAQPGARDPNPPRVVSSTLMPHSESIRLQPPPSTRPHRSMEPRLSPGHPRGLGQPAFAPISVLRPNRVGIEGRANQAPNPRFPPVPWRQKPVPRAPAQKTVTHATHLRPPGTPLPNDPDFSGSFAGLGGGAVHAMGLTSRPTPTQYDFGSTRPSPIDAFAPGLKLWS